MAENHEPPTATDQATADQRTALEHAWNWFAFHGKQRTDVFQLYLVVCAFLVAGYGSTIISRDYTISLLVSALLLISTLAFFGLDRRNKQLIKAAESYLSIEQARLFHSLKQPSIQLLAAAEQNRQIGYVTVTFSSMFKLFFTSMGIVSLAMIIYASYLSFSPSEEPAPSSVEQPA